jgi:hypothetical protein
MTLEEAQISETHSLKKRYFHCSASFSILLLNPRTFSFRYAQHENFFLRNGFPEKILDEKFVPSKP